MSNGLELKAIIDSRIQELSKDKRSTSLVETSKLHLKTRKISNEPCITTTQDNYQLQYLSLKRKELEYEALLKDADYEDDGEGLVDFSKKEITANDSCTWLEVVDEFGRNRLIKEGTVNQESRDVHYDPRKEIRNLGTGHYEFSKQQDKRLQELQELKELRQETKQGQTLKQEKRLEKTMALENRRRRIQELRAKRLK